MKIRYCCHYCGKIFDVYSYTLESIDDDICIDCKSKMTLKNIVNKEDIKFDVYGYNKQNKEIKKNKYGY